MATSFFQSVNINPTDLYASENVIVIQDNEFMDGSFLMHFTVANFLSAFPDTGRVLLLLNNESSRAWSSKSLKAGYNVTDFESNLIITSISHEEHLPDFYKY